jgi:hypothetical protein
MSHRDLRAAMRQRSAQAKTGLWRRAAQEFESEILPMEWSDGSLGREKKVLAALYGTDEGGKPGLDVLKEEKERLVKNKEEERE